MLEVAPVTAVHVGVAAVQFIDFCHTIDPTLLANVSVLELPVQIADVPVIVPAVAVVNGFKFTEAVVTELHAPFLTTALYQVCELGLAA